MKTLLIKHGWMLLFALWVVVKFVAWAVYKILYYYIAFFLKMAVFIFATHARRGPLG
ncbi:MAG: hypothetical protein Q8K97_17550 [Pseudohongiella sp.]|nr:hypothetical protein [Pseudohongiella sp.]